RRASAEVAPRGRRCRGGRRRRRRWRSAGPASGPGRPSPSPTTSAFARSSGRSYRSAWRRGRGATLVRVLATGYVYDLLRKLGLSTFGARTGEFLLVRPLKVVLVVVAAMVVSRLAARWLSRTVRSVQLRTLAGRSLRAEQRADTVAGVLSGLA